MFTSTYNLIDALCLHVCPKYHFELIIVQYCLRAQQTLLGISIEDVHGSNPPFLCYQIIRKLKLKIVVKYMLGPVKYNLKICGTHHMVNFP